MKRLLALYILMIFCVFLATPAWAGALNCSLSGSTDIVNGSDPEGPWFPHNLGSKLQIRGKFLEVGTETKIPRATYRDWRGKKFESKQMVYAASYLSFAERLDEKTVYGLDIYSEGLGASFEKISFGMDSQTLLAITYLQPYLSRQLTDRWSVGAGPVIGYSKLTWNGPLDFNRVPTPLRVKLGASGGGIGFQIGTMYQLTDSLAVGVNYISPLTASLSGHCQSSFWPLSIRDRVKTEFKFPDHLDLTVGYQPAKDWLIVGQVSRIGYSHNSFDRIGIKFDQLMIKKSVKLNWDDVYRFNVGVSHKFGSHWTVGGGCGYLTKAVGQTADFMTPDANGFTVAGRIKYSSQDFDLTCALARGYGKNNSCGKEMTIELWVISLTGTIKF